MDFVDNVNFVVVVVAAVDVVVVLDYTVLAASACVVVGSAAPVRLAWPGIAETVGTGPSLVGAFVLPSFSVDGTGHAAEP